MPTAFRVVLVAVGLLIVSAIWWPNRLEGRIVHGETGAPVADVNVLIQSSLLKPWAPLLVLAWGETLTSESISRRTDSDGRFEALIFAGVRLEHAILRFKKPGYVVRPRPRGGTGRYLLDARVDAGSDYQQALTLVAWPASENLDVGNRSLDIAYDGREFGHPLGRENRQLFLRLARDGGGVRLTARWQDGSIQFVDGLDESLVAPRESYAALAEARFDCNDRPTAFVLDDDGSYGWLTLTFPPRCAVGKPITAFYRLGADPGIRALACPSEVDRTPSGPICASGDESQ